MNFYSVLQVSVNTGSALTTLGGYSPKTNIAIRTILNGFGIPKFSDSIPLNLG